MGCAPDLFNNAEVRREALRQLELASGDEDQRLPSLEELALAAIEEATAGKSTSSASSKKTDGA